MRQLLTGSSIGVIASTLFFPSLAMAQATPADSAATEDTASTIVVTGTRRTGRTVTESAVPVDVLTSQDLAIQASGDMNNVLRNLVPSFNVGRFAGVLSDGSGFVRPPTLRGLPPDQILVLVNSKRRHRSALVQLNGGALASGAQGVDLAQIPTIAIERIEVLRDGAAAQYGSDAIAGVINYTLRKNRNGLDMRARYGQYYAGDGKNYQISGNLGLPLGPDGFVNVSGEFLDQGETSRGGQRPGAYALALARPDLTIADPVQKFGDPDVRAYRLFLNAGIDVSDSSEVYLFGNYGWSKQRAQFNYRQPYSAVGPAQNGAGTQNYALSSIYNPIYLDQLPNGTWDASGRTFNFRSVYPDGFTPMFMGRITDTSLTGGYRGETAFGLNFDVSASYGKSNIAYTMDQSINSSLGPDSPTSFYMGSLEQRETNFNADFSYDWEVGLAAPITIAFGGEHRNEAYEIGLGDLASYEAGPYTVQTLNNGTVLTQAPGVSGFPGYSPNFVVNDSRNSYAGYLDIETDITKAFTIGFAGRYEHFSDFGSTTNGKVSARYAFAPWIALRGAASTGFKAPTPGQLFTTAGVTGFVGANPTDNLTLPVGNAAAIAFGAVPLKPEKSTNLSAGFVLTPESRFNLTVDYYNIKVTDRIGLGAYIPITTDGQRDILRSAGLSNWATVGQIRFYTNAFGTRTQGVDITGTYRLPTDAGLFNTTLAVNYNKTKLLYRDRRVIDDVRVGNIEQSLPLWRATLTENWSKDKLSVTARGYYYGGWTSWALPADGGNLKVGAEFIFDLEAKFQINEHFDIGVGGENILDNYPDKNIRSRGLTNSNWYEPTQSTVNGSVYVDSSPTGYNGGFWYIRVGAHF
ncbi:MAG: TonB-dependent receptor [Sphingobium sp.]